MTFATAVPSAVLDSRRNAGWDGGGSAPAAVATRSPYEHRVDLVTDVLTRSSVTGTEEARRLAIQVLHAIDHIPEHPLSRQPPYRGDGGIHRDAIPVAPVRTPPQPRCSADGHVIAPPTEGART